MKNKMNLISILLLTTGMVIIGQGGGGNYAGGGHYQRRTGWDRPQLIKGGAIEVRLAQQRRFIPGGGFINPEDALNEDQKAALRYYRRWKRQGGKL